MSAKAIKEFDGKTILSRHVLNVSLLKAVSISVSISNNESCSDVSSCFKNVLLSQLNAATIKHPWILTEKLVVKPDQLIKRRGKSGLILLNATFEEVKNWLLKKMGTVVTVDGVNGTLKNFIIEPFIPHSETLDETYVNISTAREGDVFLFYHQGGVEIGDVDNKASKLVIPVRESTENISASAAHEKLKRDFSVLVKEVNDSEKEEALVDFFMKLYKAFCELHFTLLEINPIVLTRNQAAQKYQIHILDLAAKLDSTAEYETGSAWRIGEDSLVFPAPFGRELTPEEVYVSELDSKTGSSLKLTVLNPNGRIWTLVAGGGASVAYADAIASLGLASELANYGEYSGAPSETQTYEYSKTILDLMTRGSVHEEGKVLLIGGGIANFTNVATTFKGIIRSLTEYSQLLSLHRVQIYVRRGGPNWQEGLRLMRDLGDTLSLPIHVYGPDSHITAIVPISLSRKGSVMNQDLNLSTDSFSLLDLNGGSNSSTSSHIAASPKAQAQQQKLQTQDTIAGVVPRPLTPSSSEAGIIKYFNNASIGSGTTNSSSSSLFNASTRCFVYGMQPKAVQSMLDFDHMCKRKFPSVAAIIYPFSSGSHMMKFYWGLSETLIPVFATLDEAVAKDAQSQLPRVSVVVNFASCRSVLESTREIMNKVSTLKAVAIIAEGVPERRARELYFEAKHRGILLIGPATVGGLRAGCFKIGNTGGMIDNLLASRLYRGGSVCYVSKSGGMSNELNNIIARNSDGVLEGIAIGGDRYSGSTFLDHMLRFQDDPDCKFLVLLGEVGGVDELEVAAAVADKRITKPIVAWCIGICANMFKTEVQFGHAGALAGGLKETAAFKNKSLKDAGVIVPDSFELMPEAIRAVFDKLVANGTLVKKLEPEAPKVPIDYAWATELGLIRKPKEFVSTICDDRGQELLYAGMPISKVFKEELGIGGVVSLLWFKRRLPDYGCKFIEMVLMLTADHGPAVSGAHNTIVTARAGKDLVSSVASGLLTIGERFGGALDGAAEQFSTAFDQGLSPAEFVTSYRKQHKLILGIGHKIKSVTNPDLRVSILKEYARSHFPTTPLLDYALKVETITTTKKDNLILNVDGAIAVLFVDLVRNSGAFTPEEADEAIKAGSLNGLFVLGRSIGFIGHFLDQKRLKQGLYRHPWDDISYGLN